MLADITPVIRKGVIDNTKRDTIELLLWCMRDEEPVRLVMAGNCLRDIAGCRVQFRRTTPLPHALLRQLPLYKMLKALPMAERPLTIGDMTLSRRAPASARPGMLANRLYLEFFYDTETRFLIESEEFSHELSLPEWECSQACESAQELLNMSAMRDHISAYVDNFKGPSLSQLGGDMPSCRWDAILNRAEGYMSVVAAVHEKYAPLPHGRLAEAFVLDCSDYLAEKASDDEHGHGISTAGDRNWEILDFMGREYAEQVNEAMHHPLFEVTAELSSLVQRHILNEMQLYRDNQEIDTLLALYSGIISRVLATILLTQQRRVPVKTATERAKALGLRLEKLKRYTTPLPPTVRTLFLQGMDALAAELRNFVFTLRQ